MKALLIQARDALSTSSDYLWEVDTGHARTIATTCDEAIAALQAAIDAPEAKGLFIDMIESHEGLAEELRDAPEPVANVCKGKNCGSTNPKWHSAECFEEHDMACGSAKPVGYVRHYAIQHLSKPGHTVINHEPQDVSQETPDVALYTYSEAPVPEGWQPIKTAPKDGKESLFNTKELGRVVLYWDGFDGKWDSGFENDDHITPTHWMPLPAAPKEAS